LKFSKYFAQKALSKPLLLTSSSFAIGNGFFVFCIEIFWQTGFSYSLSKYKGPAFSNNDFSIWAVCKLLGKWYQNYTYNE